MTSFTRHLRPFLIIFLAAALLTPRTPFFAPEDVNRDARVDLRDAVLGVRVLNESAQEAESFKTSLSKTISALRVLSGFKNVIKSDENTMTAVVLEHYGAYLTPFFDVSCFDSSILFSSFTNEQYRSITKDVPTPPPKILI